MAPDTIYLPADLNTEVAPNEPLSVESPLAGWKISFPSRPYGVELPCFMPTAARTHSIHSSLDDEDVAFLDACRDRLCSQLRDND